MFTPLFIFYYGLLLLGTASAFYWWRKDDYRSLYLFFLLGGTLIFELFMDRCFSKGITTYRYFYSLFSGFEYGILILFYQNLVKVKIWRWIAVGSAALFALWSCGCAVLVHRSYHDYGYLITDSIAIEGTLLIALFSQLLFRIDDDIPVSLYRHPDFWVGVGVLIFNSGVFVVFICYPMLVKMNAVAAGQSYGFILQPANIAEYFCINLRFLCLQLNRKLPILSN